MSAWLVREAQTGDAAPAHALLLANGWAHRLGDVPRFEALLAASQRVVVAEAAGELVGFARALCDGQSNGYLSMVVVAPAWRGRGIGRALVAHIVDGHCDIAWMVNADREGAPEFFARLGFAQAVNAMRRPRVTRP
jgi:N-acetylglutamate synthase-like GNAT family acetyltransferase